MDPHLSSPARASGAAGAEPSSATPLSPTQIRQRTLFRAFATALTQTDPQDGSRPQKRDDVFCKPIGPYSIGLAHPASFVDALVVTCFSFPTFIQLVEDIAERIGAKITRTSRSAIETIKDGQRLKLWYYRSYQLVSRLQSAISSQGHTEGEGESKPGSSDPQQQLDPVDRVLSSWLSRSPVTDGIDTLWELRYCRSSPQSNQRWISSRTVLIDAGLLGSRNWSAIEEARLIHFFTDDSHGHTHNHGPVYNQGALRDLINTMPLAQHWTQNNRIWPTYAFPLSRSLSAIQTASTDPALPRDHYTALFLRSFHTALQIQLRTSALHSAFDAFEAAVISFARALTGKIARSGVFPSLLYDAETKSTSYILGFDDQNDSSQVDELLEDFVLSARETLPFSTRILPAAELLASSSFSPIDPAPPSQDSSQFSAAATASSSGHLRPAQDVYNRIRWDPDVWDPNDVIIGYLDRHTGVMEIPFADWKKDVSEEEFVPMHRIRYFRHAGVSSGDVLWDREKRIDRVFGK